MIRYLLDTNVLSEPTKPEPSRALVERLARTVERCAIAAPTWQELWFGVLRLPDGRRKHALQEYLHRQVKLVFPVLPYDGAAAERHAEHRAAFVATGRTPPFVDGQLAAIAEVHGLVLVTHNVSDFAPYEHLEVEDWLT